MATYLLSKILLFSLYVSSFLSIVKSKESFTLSNSTYCPTSKGYGICNGINAVCCDDSEYCCPSNSICDFNLKKCIPSVESQLFLNEVNYPNMTKLTIINITYNDTYLLIDGFFTALNFSNYVKSYDNCKIKLFKIGLDIINIFQIIEEYRQFEDKSKAISIILREIGNALNDFYFSYLSCRNITTELSDLGILLVKYFSNPLYFRSLYNNLIKNTFFFMNMWANAKSRFDLGQYFEAGRELGELFSVVLFPEIEGIKSSEKDESMLEIESNVKENRLGLIIKCGIETILSNFSEMEKLSVGKEIEENRSFIIRTRNQFYDCLTNKI